MVQLLLFVQRTQIVPQDQIDAGGEGAVILFGDDAQLFDYVFIQRKAYADF